MTAAEVLVRARAIYAAAPSHAALSFDPEPGTYCVYSAVEAVTGPDAEDRSYEAEHALIAEVPASYAGVVDFNAENSTEAVLDLFDRAIARMDARRQ